MFAGLKEAHEIVKGAKSAKRKREIIIPELSEYKGVEIKRLRKSVALTQQTFAAVLGVSVKTVEAWEASRNIPEGPTQRILCALDKNKNFFKMFGVKVQ
ncbi:MAG TPA: helix-turn-helix domain-containing protein [Ignavibacteria bacterium]|nr:helix-turn-helix domain-containing protein [Ignavibacteria bacterium]